MGVDPGTRIDNTGNSFHSKNVGFPTRIKIGIFYTCRFECALPGGVLVDGDVDEELLGQPVVVVELHHSWEPGGQGRPAGAGRLLVHYVPCLALVGGFRVPVVIICLRRYAVQGESQSAARTRLGRLLGRRVAARLLLLVTGRPWLLSIAGVSLLFVRALPLLVSGLVAVEARHRRLASLRMLFARTHLRQAPGARPLPDCLQLLLLHSVHGHGDGGGFGASAGHRCRRHSGERRKRRVRHRPHRPLSSLSPPPVGFSQLL